MNLAVIPSPSQSVWHLGPLPIRAYALCIILGIVAACVVTEIRLRRRGVPAYTVLDIAVWAVPFGIIGARIYHVITTPDSYFGADGDLGKTLQIWEGGLGIWGAVLGGAVGAWIACRRLGLPLTVLADALAPGLPLAQAIGRWGNWFNNELYGGTTDLPWGIRVYEWDISSGEAVRTATGEPAVLGVYHPAFLYESLWDVGVAVFVWLLDRRYRFGKGRAFALYVMAYCVGRFWIEWMRTDPASELLGMRLNNWTAIVVFAAALAYFLLVRGSRELVTVDADGLIRPATGETAGEPGDRGADAGEVDEVSNEEHAPSGDEASDPSAETGEEAAEAGDRSTKSVDEAAETGDKPAKTSPAAS